MERGIEDAVVMDEKTFKSLTSKSRTQILKLLKKRNHTLSEISEKLKISKTTVKEHIDVLIEGRLIEQVPSHHKWKYYTLTKDGRKLVGEEGPKRVVITLVALVIGLFISVYGFSGFMESIRQDIVPAVELSAEPMAGGDARTFDAEKAEEPITAVTEEAGTYEDYMDAENEAAVPEETQVETEPFMMPPPDYLMLVLGIVGIVIMGTALLMLIRSKKQRSVL